SSARSHFSSRHPCGWRMMRFARQRDLRSTRTLLRWDAMPDPLEPALPRTIIRNAAWYAAAKAHVYHRDVDLATEGDTIAAIGPALPADYSDAVEIAGRGFAILPGFVDMHAHPPSEPMLKGPTNELGSRQLYEYLPLFDAEAEAATEVAPCELIRTNVSATLIDGMR